MDNNPKGQIPQPVSQSAAQPIQQQPEQLVQNQPASPAPVDPIASSQQSQESTKKKWIIIAVIIVVLIIVGAVVNALVQKATNKIAEKAAENILEESFGGMGIDVDLDSGGRGQMKVDTGEGTIVVGEDISVPKECGDDIIVYPNSKIVSASCIIAEQTRVVTFMSADSRNDIIRYLEKEIEKKSWIEEGVFNMEGMYTKYYIKGGERLTLTLMDNTGDNNEHMISIGIVPKEL